MSGILDALQRHALVRVVAIMASALWMADAAAQATNASTDKTDKATQPRLAYTPDPITTTSLPLSGKLFFTDDKRAQLDKARRDGTIIVEGETVPRMMVLNGFVKRSDGSTVYWVNDGGKTESRYTKVPSRDLMATSSMVGAEPTFILSGATKGAGPAAEDAKAISQSKGSPAPAKKKVVKKKTAPTKSKKPPQLSPAGQKQL